MLVISELHMLLLLVVVELVLHLLLLLVLHLLLLLLLLLVVVHLLVLLLHLYGAMHVPCCRAAMLIFAVASVQHRITGRCPKRTVRAGGSRAKGISSGTLRTSQPCL